MKEGFSFRLTQDTVTFVTETGTHVASGPIEAQTRDWWASLRDRCAGQDEIAVVLDPPESYSIRLPKLPRSRRETRLLVDRLAPIRLRHLAFTVPCVEADATTVSIAHAARLQSLRELFANNDVPPPTFLSPDGVSFGDDWARPDKATRTTATFIFASLLAIPILALLGATLLATRVNAVTASIERARRAENDALGSFRELAGGPTVAAQVARIVRRLPDEGAISAISSADGRIAITVDGTTSERLRRALIRTGTFADLREDSRKRIGDSYQVVFSGVPR